MSDSELEFPEGTPAATAESRHDEDDRLKPEFVRAVVERVEAGDAEGARLLVEPLHPADIADLLELVDRDERRALATTLAGLLDGDVLAELNDWVRDELLPRLPSDALVVLAGRGALGPGWRADPAWSEQLRTISLRNLDPEDSREYLGRRGVPRRRRGPLRLLCAQRPAHRHRQGNDHGHRAQPQQGASHR